MEKEIALMRQERQDLLLEIHNLYQQLDKQKEFYETKLKQQTALVSILHKQNMRSNSDDTYRLQYDNKLLQDRLLRLQIQLESEKKRMKKKKKVQNDKTTQTKLSDVPEEESFSSPPPPPPPRLPSCLPNRQGVSVAALIKALDPVAVESPTRVHQASQTDESLFSLLEQAACDPAIPAPGKLSS